ncbi:hypothetical protein L1987_45906 [Smallanthus sonchifolius]|uniref:Uncharacterized protein n=1 Tax=Smallanthus sonchifolius TaxID=185202 RepID=A0ACB9FZB5_9ASTR|nr:hypothetical protein L1987_45906 [Smallanthus sonchifolius]
MSRAPRWRVRGGNPKEEQKEGWVLVGQGHPASNRMGLSSGSSLLVEMNRSEGAEFSISGPGGRYVSLSGSLAPLVIFFYDMLLSSPYSICHLVISSSLRVSTSERNGGLHSVTPRSPSERSE